MGVRKQLWSLVVLGFFALIGFTMIALVMFPTFTVLLVMGCVGLLFPNRVGVPLLAIYNKARLGMVKAVAKQAMAGMIGGSK